MRALGRDIAVLDRGPRRARGRGGFGFLFPIFTMGSAIGWPTVKCFRFVYENLTTKFRSANVSLESSIRDGLFGDIFIFKIKVGVYEKLAKSNDCSTKTYAATLVTTSIFRTGLLLALAMCAGLAQNVGRSWCAVINSPATTFAVVIKPPRGILSQRRGPLPKLLGRLVNSWSIAPFTMCFDLSDLSR